MVTLALGMVVLALTARADAGAWWLLPGLLIIGLASGAKFAPVQHVTMDGVTAELAGAASGVANTTRQVGGVVGTALVGNGRDPAEAETGLNARSRSSRAT
ncbi:hypothetical protein [Actinomadura macra]|uniref:hypothetical protein n=1 Tax=Actinomadura macra TaxID=46164 RepID=UPI001470FF99|nr:hypothetical protein [Actinomadura macra]